MRQDFLHLTPETLAALANWGLVKRAQREAPPALEEKAGRLLARFEDGAVCTFSAGRPAGEGTCTCAASGWCRHLVGALLACAQGGAQAEAVDFRVDPDEIRRSLGERLWKKARALKSRGLTVEVLGPPWEVRLPGCTVRFLVGGQAGYCKCDCEAGQACEHWALAAWAVEERAGSAGRVIWSPAGASARLEHCAGWLRELLQSGCGQSEALWKVWGKRVSIEVAGFSWVRVLVEEVRELGQAYQYGAATYDGNRWLFCVLSLALRLRDGGHLLGGDVVWEQELEHTRLMCLGCRLRGAGSEFYWADSSGQVLLQRLAGRVHSLGPLQEVARSQVVSRGVVRRADGSLRFRRDRQRHSLAPLDLDWRNFPPALIWPGAGPREVRLVQPPMAASNYWVVPIEWAEPQGYDAGAQALLARVGDLHGGVLQLRRAHQQECPGALDALAQHLGQALWIAGVVEGDRLEPLVLGSAQRLVVLDLEQGCPPFQWPLTFSEAGDPLQALLQEALSLCEQAAQLGLAQLLPSFQERRRETARRLEEAALLRLSRALSQEWREESFWGAALRCWLAAERSRCTI